MAVTGKTKQYQSLSENVKGYSNSGQKQLLKTDEVKQLFSDFGYTPNKTDLIYWGAQPETAKVKLIGDLKKRKDNYSEIERQKTAMQEGPNHLSDQNITKIYSEYGFPVPKSGNDFSWIKNNLPDDEKKMRSILDMRRKEMDQTMKIKGQNTINSIKNQSKNNIQSNPNKGMLINNQIGQYSGQGGPGDSSGQSVGGGTKWVIPSRYAVVKFNGDPNGSAEGDATTLWLLDSQSKQIQPFLSMTGFQNFFGENSQAALKSVVNLDPNDLINGGPGSEFDLRDNSYGISDSGQAPMVDASQQQIKSLYGKTPDTQAVSNSYAALDGYLDLLNKNGGAGINSSTISNILNDQNQMAKYISAIAYGGYSLNDVYKDIKRKELINNGDQSLQNIQVIDPSATKQEYLNTNQGQLSQGIGTLNPPASIGGMNSSILNSPITQLPQEAFNTLVPPIDINSQAFKDQMESVQSAFHDILIDQVNATTESEKASADNKYNDYKEYIQKNYGIKMSNDIIQGWQQLQQLMAQSGAAGLAGSGVEAEQIDNVLKEVRTQDSKWRELMNKDIQSSEADNTKLNASPAEILKMNQEDQANGLPKSEWRASKMGLVPSDEILASLDINALKQKYPDQSEEDLQRMRSEILDENGSYRSSLYQNNVNNLNKIQYGGTMADKLATTGSLQNFKENTVFGKNLAEQQKASAPYTLTDPNKPFDNLGTSTTNIPTNLATSKKTIITPTSTQYNNDIQSNVNKQFTSNTPIQNNTNKNYIPNVESMSNFSNITKDTTPGSNKLFGTPKTSTPQTTTPFSVKPGSSYIPNVASMSKYKDVYKDTTPGSNKLYGTLK